MLEIKCFVLGKNILLKNQLINILLLIKFNTVVTTSLNFLIRNLQEHESGL